MLSDEDLLDFDLKKLARLREKPRTLLAKHGDLYRNHLLIARWLEGYQERRAKNAPLLGSLGPKPEFEEGVADTLGDIAAHLRQGDFLPDGRLYKD